MFMVLVKQNILFIHIPKTGGQSITVYLLENNNQPTDNLNNSDFGLINNNNFKLKGPQHYHHMFLTEYEKMYKIKNYFIFSVVRNPFDRFVSAFYYSGFAEEYDYVDMIDIIPTLKKNKKLDLYRMFCPQYKFFEGKSKIDKIFKTENLHESFNFLNNKFQFKSTKDYFINSRNKTRKPLNETTKNFIKNYYKDDFEKFGYSYETP